MHHQLEVLKIQLKSYFHLFEISLDTNLHLLAILIYTYMHIKKIQHNTILVKTILFIIRIIEINNNSKFVISSHMLCNAHL
jgi:sterol desaturase/sphingolipid hydroxylase (fatty acid hydroxylase superfamily)